MDGQVLVRDRRDLVLLHDQTGLTGTPVRVAIRPEWLDLFPRDAVPADENSIPGVVAKWSFAERRSMCLSRSPEETMTVALRNEGQLTRPIPWRAGDAVAVGWLPEDCQLLEDA
jgi:hypothetical protein